MDDGKKHAIMRWINYKDASMTKLADSIKYIANPESAPESFRRGFWISRENPLHGLQVINKRWNPKGERYFKHGIFSFGVPNLKPEEAFNVSSEILEPYAEQYPILMAIHTNIPQRVHCHFLLGTVAVRTGKKFEQSPREFYRFRDHFNAVAKKHCMPTLKNARGEHSSITPVVQLLASSFDGDDGLLEIFYEDRPEMRPSIGAFLCENVQESLQKETDSAGKMVQILTWGR